MPLLALLHHLIEIKRSLFRSSRDLSILSVPTLVLPLLLHGTGRFFGGVGTPKVGPPRFFA